MKKILCLLAMTMTLMSTALCFAADGGDLNKEQRAAEKLIDAFDGAPVPAYTEITPFLAADLEKKLGEQGYTDLQKTVRERFGNMSEFKFLSFQRFDQGDRVTYLGGFSKEKIVVMVFGFDKTGKMVDFVLSPYQQPEEQKAPEGQQAAE